MFMNKMQISFKISPNLLVYQNVNPNLFLSLDDPAFQNYSFSYSTEEN